MRTWAVVVVLSAVSACRSDPSAPVVSSIHLEFVARPDTATAGQPMSTISVSVFDGLDRAVRNPTEVTLVAPVSFDGPHRVTTIGGVATFEGIVFTQRAAGLRFVATAEGATRTSGPFDVRAAEASRVTIALTAATPQVQAGTIAPLEITVHDRFGNTVPDASLTLSANDPNDLLAPATGATSQAGTFTPTFITTEPGQKTVTVVTSRLTAQTSFEAIAAPVRASQSSVTASPSRLLADGHDTATVHVVLRDEFGNPVVHQLVGLDATGSAVIFPTKRTTDLNGEANFTARSTTVGAVTFTASVQSTRLTSPSISFTPPTFHLVVYAEGLTSGAVALTSPGQGDLTLTPGTERAEFPMPLAAPGQPYSVRVTSQPPGQVCRVFGADGLTMASNAFVRVWCGTPWNAVVDGLDFSAAIRGDGTLWAWGSVVGQRWGSPLFPVEFDASTDWQQVAANQFFVLGLRADGSLWEGGSGAPMKQLGTDTDWATLTGGIELHATKTDGTLWVFSSPFGPLPNTPTLVGTSSDHWRSVSGGAEGAYRVPFTVAVKTDGTLWVWGSNELGTLGLGTFVDVPTPTQLGTDTDWARVSAGQNHSLAIKTDGSLWTWGSDPVVLTSAPPHRVGLGLDWATVSANKVSKLLSPTHDVLLKTDGTMWTFDGTGLPTQFGAESDWALVDQWSAIKRDGSRWTALFPLNYGWVYPMGRLPPVPLVLPSSQGFVAISAGARQSCAVAIDGSLRVWGGGATWTPTLATPATSWSSVAAMGTLTAGVRLDGTAMMTSSFGNFTVAVPGNWVEVMLYGVTPGDARGLRNDATLWSLSPLVELMPGTHWTTIDGTGSAGIMEDGTRWLWANSGAMAQQVDSSTRWISASAVDGVRADGTLWSQGVQLGTDDTWTSVVSYYGRTFAIKRDGSLWGLGDNWLGTISTGLPQPVTSLTRIGTGNDWVSIATGDQHTIGLRGDGSLWVWGNDGFGQLGDGLPFDGFRFAP